MRKIILVIALLFPLSAHAQTGQRAPELVLRDIDGRRFSLSKNKGKVILLNFWATWCPPCRAEMPDLIRWQRRYGKRGLQVVGVTYPPNNLKQIRKFVQRIRVNYPIVIGTTEAKSQFMRLQTLPITIVIDRDLVIREKIEGIILPEEFEEKIKPLLTEQPPQRRRERTGEKLKK